MQGPLPERGPMDAAKLSPPDPPARPTSRVKSANRDQLVLRMVEVEKLIPLRHPARMIWQLVGQLDLSHYEAKIEAVAGQAGRPAWDPQLLISVWVYAYSKGISSAREIEQRCSYDPAFQWLTGLEVINHHTLSDFRSSREAELKELFVQLLGVLSSQQLIRLKRVAHDGCKIRALASDKSFRRGGTLARHLQQAQQLVEQLSEAGSEELSARRQQARQRAARQRVQRLEEAQRQLAQWQRNKPDQSPEAARISESDPEARIMRTGHDGFIPAYNVQLSTDERAGMVVGVAVTQEATDVAQLQPALEQIVSHLEKKPEQMLVDGGYISQANVVALSQQDIDLIGPWVDRKEKGREQLKRRQLDPAFYPEAFRYQPEPNVYQCPAGQRLSYEGSEVRPFQTRHRYRAKPSTCRACALQWQCCPKTKKGRSLVRIEAAPEVKAFQEKMQTPLAQQLYKKRAPLAEFTNAWIKEKMKLRQFRLRGLKKVRLEILWACLSYNLQQWIRCCRTGTGKPRLSQA
jgi:transposase